MLENRPEPGGEVEVQLADPFNYEKEDQIIEAWEKAKGQMLNALARISFEMAPQVQVDPIIRTAVRLK